MKIINKAWLVLSLAGCIFIFDGCATPVITPQQTIPAQPAQTNTVTGTITPAQPATVVPASTNYVPNTTLTQVGTTIQAVAPLAPAPYSPLVYYAGSLLLALGTGIAGYKNAAAKHVGAIQAIVSGVESAIGGNPTLLASTTQAITNAAKANGSTATIQAVPISGTII